MTPTLDRSHPAPHRETLRGRAALQDLRRLRHSFRHRLPDRPVLDYSLARLLRFHAVGVPARGRSRPGRLWFDDHRRRTTTCRWRTTRSSPSAPSTRPSASIRTTRPTRAPLPTSCLQNADTPDPQGRPRRSVSRSANRPDRLSSPTATSTSLMKGQLDRGVEESRRKLSDKQIALARQGRSFRRARQALQHRSLHLRRIEQA